MQDSHTPAQRTRSALSGPTPQADSTANGPRQHDLHSYLPTSNHAHQHAFGIQHANMASKPTKESLIPAMMPPAQKETFGNLGPWAEPSWYSSLASPYYNESHKRLRNALRTYIDTNIKPYMLEWEEKGEVPTSEQLKWARTGFAFGDVPAPYRAPDVPGPAGIPVGELDVFHLLISTDEASRMGGISVALGGGSVIGVPPIVAHGTEEQKRKWLPGLFTWETSFALGITEPSGGVGIHVRTRETRELTLYSRTWPTSRPPPPRRQMGSFTSSMGTRSGSPGCQPQRI